jgi:hypothetical protein
MDLLGGLHSKGFEASFQNTRDDIKKEKKSISEKFLPFIKSNKAAISKEQKNTEIKPKTTTFITFEAPGIVRYAFDLNEKV